MPSHLTRTVFRRLLSNNGLVLRCPAQTAAAYNRHRRSFTNGGSLHGKSFFGFSQKPIRQPKKPELAPGYAKMLELNTRIKTSTRRPPREEVIDAFHKFFQYKYGTKQQINNLQVDHALRTINFITATRNSVIGVQPTIDLQPRELQKALKCLALMPPRPSSIQLDFANAVFAELKRIGAANFDVEEPSDSNQWAWLSAYLTVLSRNGSTTKALNLLEEVQNAGAIPRGKKLKRQLWTIILNGFSTENNEAELLRVYESIKEEDGQPQWVLIKPVIDLYAARDDIETTKIWFRKVSFLESEAKGAGLQAVLDFSFQNNELEWCNEIFEWVLEHRNFNKPVWDVVFQWASGSLGKGVEEVEQMILVMLGRQSNDRTRPCKPDNDTIRGLVAVAARFNDAYLAERYIALGLKFGIKPDAGIYILQLKYRVMAGDLVGAQVAYEALQREEIYDGEDLPAINKYICALCASKTDTYNRIVSITTDLNERDVRLEADTVAALSSMYLKRGEFPEVVDILQVNTFHHDLEERTVVRNALVNFCMDRSNSDARVWQTYGLIRDIFLETDVDTRTKLMNEFFARRRPDMASHVFGHMRAHDRPEIRPVCETYVQCLEGIARNADRESLDMVHNMMKLDSSVEPTTRLYNSLMMAYTACGDAYRAVDFWLDIINSREGPSYNSLEIVFTACGKRPFGDKTAREIWDKMKRMNIDITPRVFSAYCSALAGQGKYEEVKTLIERMEQEVGFGLNYMTLGIFYNSTRGVTRKESIESWAKELYPEQWAELEKFGQTEDNEGWDIFNIVVEMNA